MTATQNPNRIVLDAPDGHKAVIELVQPGSDLSTSGGRFRLHGTFGDAGAGSGAKQWFALVADDDLEALGSTAATDIEGWMLELDLVWRTIYLWQPTKSGPINLDSLPASVRLQVWADASTGGHAHVEIERVEVCTTKCADGLACTNDTCDDGVCDHIATAYPCSDGDPCTNDQCDPEAGCLHVWENCPASCRDILLANPDAEDGMYAVDPDGKEGQPGYFTRCDMTRGGGGWTLVAGVHDDGQNNWTWNYQSYWGGTDPTTFGDATSTAIDFRSEAMNRQPARDVLFVHSSGVWAAYHDVVGDEQSLGAFIDEQPPGCLTVADGFPLSDGTLTKAGSLCSTNLYFNAADCDGDANAFGPVWSAGPSCPLDTPGTYSLGPDQSAPAVESGRGFAHAIGAAAEDDWTRVYVRAPVGCTSEGAVCDDLDPCTTGDTCDASLKCVGVGACPRDCAAHQASGGVESKVFIDPDGDGGRAPFEVLCLPEKDGGGWTLVAIVADDGDETWTWNDRHLWDNDDQRIFGDLNDLSKDLKSRAYHDAPATDVLFIHRPSNTWAAYHDVGGASQGLSDVVTAIGGPKCLDAETAGFPLAAGNLQGGDLCSTKLYFNANDHDGPAGCPGDVESYGPVWSASPVGNCPFDGPGDYALGTSAGAITTEAGDGFAKAINAASDDDWTEIYVRAEVGCGIEDGVPCDDGNACTGPDTCSGGQCGGDDVLCDDGDPCTQDVCVAGECVFDYQSCRRSCAEWRADEPTMGSGPAYIDPDGPDGEPGFEVHCNMDRDGGGWTLVAVVSADDGDYWTYKSKAKWENADLAHDELETDKDHKSEALAAVPMEDVLFEHPNSGLWAAYHDVGDGTQSLAATIAALNGVTCYLNPKTEGHPLTAGNIWGGGNMCNTRLYFNCRDLDGGSTCPLAADGFGESTFGPCWDTFADQGCHFDDAAHGGLGMSAATLSQQTQHMGFATALGFDPAFMQVYVRGRRRGVRYRRSLHHGPDLSSGQLSGRRLRLPVDLRGRQGGRSDAPDRAGVAGLRWSRAGSAVPNPVRLRPRRGRLDARGRVRRRRRPDLDVRQPRPVDRRSDAVRLRGCDRHVGLGCFNAMVAGRACTSDGECDDGNGCTADACLSGKCHSRPRNCAEAQGDACTDWLCLDGACADGGPVGGPDCAICQQPCSGDEVCTFGEIGDVGVCVSGCCEYSQGAETCDNQIDDNANGVVDESCVWYVDGDADPGGDGTSWDEAVLTVQEAVLLADAGEQIWVKQGDYHANGATVVTMVDGVPISIYGGFAGGEVAVVQRPRPLVHSVLDGKELAAPVVLAVSNSLLSGLAIVDGMSTKSSGAGLEVGFSSGVTVSDCFFEGNVGTGTSQGGAVWDGGADNVYERCTFVGNSSKHGGAIQITGDGARTFEACDFVGNTTTGDGGAVVNSGLGDLAFVDCTFDGNQGNQAGAISTGGGVLTVTRGAFTFNTATLAGAIKANGSATSVIVQDSTFVSNQATSSSAGAIVSLEGQLDITGSTFTGNTAAQSGGAVFAQEATLLIDDCTFAGNDAENGGDGATEG